MTTVTFSGSLWALLLLPPGLYILWRQIPRGEGRGPAHAAVFVLQALALLLLVVSLLAPELRRLGDVFHPPAVILAVDGSGSFRGGDFLGAAEKAEGTVAGLRRHFAGRGFKVVEFAFHEHAAPGGGGGDRAPSMHLSDFSALGRHVDSMGLPNVKGMFLVSDGRRTAGGPGLAPEPDFPVFPILMALDSVAECQLSAVEPLEDGEGAIDSVEVRWAPVGRLSKGPRLRLLLGKEELFSGSLPRPGEGEAEMRVRLGLPAKLPASSGASGRLLRAVLAPAEEADNLTFLNDTLEVPLPGNGKRRIYVIAPLRSIEERAMMDHLTKWDSAEVKVVRADDAEGLKAYSPDQVWVSAGNLLGKSRLLDGIFESGAVPVVYSVIDYHAGLAGLLSDSVSTRSFGPGVALGRASGYGRLPFPDHTPLESISDARLVLPLAGAEESAAITALGDPEGVLVGKWRLAHGRAVWHLVLPAAWSKTFSASPSYTSQSLLLDFFASAAGAAGISWDGPMVFLPPSVVAGVPFRIEAAFPPGWRDGESAPALELELHGEEADRRIAGELREGRYAFPPAALPPGRFALRLHSAGGSWERDTLVVPPKEVVEMARIGFDRIWLQALAGRTGGAVLHAESLPAAIPALPSAELQESRGASLPLYNNLAVLLTVTMLLSASWVLRKRLNLD